MAIVQNPLIGRTRNSVGNTIFYTSLKKNILRSKPIIYRDANSITQQKNRLCFNLTMNTIQNSLNMWKYLNFNRMILNGDNTVYHMMLSYIKKLYMYNEKTPENLFDAIAFNKTNFLFGPNEIPRIILKDIIINSDLSYSVSWDSENFNGLIPANAEIWVLCICQSRIYSYFDTVAGLFSDHILNSYLAPGLIAGDKVNFLVFAYDKESFLCSASSFVSDNYFSVPV